MLPSHFTVSLLGIRRIFRANLLNKLIQPYRFSRKVKECEREKTMEEFFVTVVMFNLILKLDIALNQRISTKCLFELRDLNKSFFSSLSSRRNGPHSLK